MSNENRVTNNSAICLVVDRLHAGFLGAMGNSWVRTPMFDRLASQSLLLDSAIADTGDLAQLYRGYWQGRHALEPVVEGRENEGSSLPQQLATAGVRTLLLTDDECVAELPGADQFAERIVLPCSRPIELAASIEESGFAQFFAAAIDLIDRMNEPTLLWLHMRGMSAPWDAPLELREAFADEEDPDALTTVDVPCQQLSPNFDPDELLSITQAYVAQAAVWDACLGTLVDALDDSRVKDRTLLNVLGARGFPLGEHLAVGAASAALYGELLQVPWVVRFPEQRAVSIRTSQLVQPPDLFATLGDWWQLGTCSKPPFCESLFQLADAEGDWTRERACSVGEEQAWAIRTRAWFARGEEGNDDGSSELFTKPDDRFEVNEISARCGEIRELMREAFQEARLLAESEGEPSAGALSPLDRRLIEGMA